MKRATGTRDASPGSHGDLRGTPRYALIELMFFAYRDFVEDADRILLRDGFGRAHHRVLYFATRRPSLTVAELLDILRITKQSLNRVLKDLLDRGYVNSRLGDSDRRQRLLTATPKGEALIRRIAEIQSARFERVFAKLGPDAEARAAIFLKAVIDCGAADHSADVEGGMGEFDRIRDADVANVIGAL
jgi:DNA-binding MarR family transcriptional regulator